MAPNERPFNGREPAIYHLVIYHLPFIVLLEKLAKWEKAGAKVLLFFELTKFFCIFFILMRVFVLKRQLSTPVPAVPVWEEALIGDW